MTVRIFKDKSTGDYAVQTTCLKAGDFLAELCEALPAAMGSHNEDQSVAAFGILRNAFPIAYKLDGYKADEVTEQRTLLCGTVSPSDSDMVSSAGR